MSIVSARLARRQLRLHEFFHLLRHRRNRQKAPEAFCQGRVKAGLKRRQRLGLPEAAPGRRGVGDLAQSLEDGQTRDAPFLVRAVEQDQDHVFALLHLAALNAPDAEAADVVVVVDGRDQQLQRRVVVARWGGDALEDGVEQRAAVVVAVLQLGAHDPRASDGIEDRKVELLVGGAELDHQVKHFVDHLDRTGVAAIDFVDDHDRQEAEAESLAQDEARLRHRAFGGVDEEDHAVDHGEDALHFAAEVGVAGGVDDVDLHFGRMDEDGRKVVTGGGVRRLVVHRMAEGVGTVDEVTDRGVLGQDGDAALALQIVRVHDPLVDLLVGADGAGLLEEGVDERGLAVVDVRDDRDVANVVAELLHARALTRWA